MHDAMGGWHTASLRECLALYFGRVELLLRQPHLVHPQLGGLKQLHSGVVEALEGDYLGFGVNHANQGSLLQFRVKLTGVDVVHAQRKEASLAIDGHERTISAA